MASVFTRIIDGELPGAFVWRDERCVAFLSINPIAPGHTLVVPIDEVDEWTDLDPELARHLFAVAHTIGRAQKEAFECERIGVIVAGYEVPHTHVHVIPTRSMDDLRFDRAGDATADELATTAATLVAALEAQRPG